MTRTYVYWSPQLSAWIDANYPKGLPWYAKHGDWKLLLDRVQNEIDGPEGERAIKWLSVGRYERRLRDIQEKALAKRWRALGELGKWLRAMIDDARERCGDPCIDNERWAEMRVSSQMRRYRRQQERGCCGRWDEEVKHPETGRRFMIGFNFGH